jgi:hypothetical protein
MKVNLLVPNDPDSLLANRDTGPIIANPQRKALNW